MSCVPYNQTHVILFRKGNARCQLLWFCRIDCVHWGLSQGALSGGFAGAQIDRRTRVISRVNVTDGRQRLERRIVPLRVHVGALFRILVRTWVAGDRGRRIKNEFAGDGRVQCIPGINGRPAGITWCL